MPKSKPKKSTSPVRARDERIELRLSPAEKKKLGTLVKLRKASGKEGLHTQSQVLRDLLEAAFAASRNGEYRP